jgi:hypothetical protein
MRVRRLPISVLIPALGVVFVCGVPLALRAQELTAPAHIAFADGSVLLDHEGQTETAVAGAPFVPGDRLRTAASRVEVLFPDGSALALDEYSSLDLQAPSLLRLTAGRLILSVAGAYDPASSISFQIDTPVASATTDGPGEYRVALLAGPAGYETELAVLRGSASLRTERGALSVRAGERTLARELETPSFPQAFNSARFDAFDRWSALRRDARLGTAQSTQYLPPDLRMYGGTFDRYGGWQYEAPYGQVWYPTVTPDWRPYHNGYWSSSRQYGWTWIGLEGWGWPTYHYGRWGHARNRWFWIPDRRFGPAWVSWAAAPGYVSWCPLGFDNRPVFALSVNVGNPYRGWTVLPRGRFGAPGAYAHRYAVPRLPAAAPFIVQAGSPVPPRVVVNGPPPGAAANYAVPRRPGRDVAVPRAGTRGAAASATQSAPSAPSGVVPGVSPATGVAQGFSPANRQPGGVQGPRSGAAQEFSSTTGAQDMQGKQPLAGAPRAVDRSRSPSQTPSAPTSTPWYGQSGRWYGTENRAVPRGGTATQPAPAPSTPVRQNPAYYRRPEAASPPPAQSQQPSSGEAAPAPQTSAPRWGSPARSRPAESAPAASAPSSPPPQSRAAVPRGGRSEGGARSDGGARSESSAPADGGSRRGDGSGSSRGAGSRQNRQP